MKKAKNGNRLTDKEIMKEALAESGYTQKLLAEKLGMSQTGISGSMNRGRTSLPVFCKLLDVMGYDVAVVDRKDGTVRWIVDGEN